MPLTYDAWGNAQNSDPTPQFEGYWESGGPEGERIWRANVPIIPAGQNYTDTAGNVFTYNAGQVGGENHGAGAGFTYQSPQALAAQQEAARQGPSNMYKFDQYGYTRNVAGLPTLAADTFEQGLNNPWLARMYNTADKGSWYTGIGALTGDMQNLGALRLQGGTSYDPSNPNQQYSDATYRDLAQFMGIDTNAPNWQQQVNDQANNYAMVKGMGGYNPEDPRQVNQILYKRQEDGQWAPVLNRAYHEREKGSWWSEGGKYIMVPLGVVGAGLAAGAMAGAGGAGSGAAATGGGITGTGGASGMAAYGAEGLGSYLGTAGTGSLGAGMAGGASTLGGSLGAYGGAGLFADGGITAAQAASIGPYQGANTLQRAKDAYNKVNKARKLWNTAKGLFGGDGQGGSGPGGLAGRQGGSSGSGSLGGPGEGYRRFMREAEQAYAPVASEAKMKRLRKSVGEQEG